MNAKKSSETFLRLHHSSHRTVIAAAEWMIRKRNHRMTNTQFLYIVILPRYSVQRDWIILRVYNGTYIVLDNICFYSRSRRRSS